MGQFPQRTKNSSCCVWCSSLGLRHTQQWTNTVPQLCQCPWPTAFSVFLHPESLSAVGKASLTAVVGWVLGPTMAAFGASQATCSLLCFWPFCSFLASKTCIFGTWCQANVLTFHHDLLQTPNLYFVRLVLAHSPIVIILIAKFTRSRMI